MPEVLPISGVTFATRNRRWHDAHSVRMPFFTPAARRASSCPQFGHVTSTFCIARNGATTSPHHARSEATLHAGLATRYRSRVDREKRPEDVTLLDVLIDGFEKNEILWGRHWRVLPMPDEASAIRKCESLIAEARRWKGAPERELDEPPRRLAAWADLEIRRAGRGIMVLARSPWFSRWWSAAETWKDDPIGPLHAWLAEEHDR